MPGAAAISTEHGPEPAALQCMRSTVLRVLGGAVVLVAAASVKAVVAHRDDPRPAAQPGLLRADVLASYAYYRRQEERFGAPGSGGLRRRVRPNHSSTY